MSNNDEYFDVIRDVKNIIGLIMIKEPFIGLFLKRTWIYIDKESPSEIYTNGKEIFINPALWRRLNELEKTFELIHVAMHMILMHPTRLEKYMRDPNLAIITQIVADAKANQHLTNVFPSTTLERLRIIRPMPETVEKLFNIRDVEKKSAEEIMEELLRRARKSGSEGDIGRDVKEYGEVNKDVKGSSLSNKNQNLIVINKGDPQDQNISSPKELEERIKRKTLETFMAMKVAGRKPGNIEQVIDELVKPEINWRDILRPLLIKGLGMDIRRSWMKINIIHPDDLPGKERLRRKEVAVLIDTSGSISEEELKRFVSEVFGILRETSEVIVIQWDAKAYDPIIVKSYRDIDKIRVIYGRGGTEILPALKIIDEKYRDVDSIIIFSDWYIADLNESEVQKLLRKYSRKILAFTTSEKPPQYLRSFKIKIST